MNASVSKALGKVAVLMGGASAEREISLQSGGAVLAALQSAGIDAKGIDVDAGLLDILLQEKFDRAFIMLHGRGGEDGTMQGFLETLGIPYTGSGVMASALAMDKLRTKQIWTAAGLPTPAYYVIDSPRDYQQALQTVGLPLIIKPVLEGSSIGMSKVEQASELAAAWEKASQCGGTVIAEKWVDGKEYTAAVLGDQVLPMIRLQTSHKFYDYDAKYQSDETQYICPCGLSDDNEKQLATLILKAFKAVGAKAWGRVDFMIDKQGLPWLIEVNTVPGMTSHSLVPMAASHANITFEQLVQKILLTTLAEAEV